MLAPQLSYQTIQPFLLNVIVLHIGSFFYLLGVVLRTFHLTERYSTTWVTPLAPFALVIIFEGLTLWPGQTTILLFVLAYVTGMTDTHQPCPVIGKNGLLRTFCQGWPWIEIIPISTTQVTRITSLSHHTQSLNIFISIN
jgi:hypothetical protein